MGVFNILCYSSSTVVYFNLLPHWIARFYSNACGRVLMSDNWISVRGKARGLFITLSLSLAKSNVGIHRLTPSTSLYYPPPNLHHLRNILVIDKQFCLVIGLLKRCNADCQFKQTQSTHSHEDNG